LTWVLLDKEEFPSFAPEQPDIGEAGAASLGEFGMPGEES